MAAAAAEGSGLQRFESSQLSMGTLVEVVLYAPDEPAANGAFRAAFERIGQIDRAMSDYDADSELMRLCRQAPTAAPSR